MGGGAQRPIAGAGIPRGERWEGAQIGRSRPLTTAWTAVGIVTPGVKASCVVHLEMQCCS